jgi:hypothetical protein
MALVFEVQKTAFAAGPQFSMPVPVERNDGGLRDAIAKSLVHELVPGKRRSMYSQLKSKRLPRHGEVTARERSCQFPCRQLYGHGFLPELYRPHLA